MKETINIPIALVVFNRLDCAVKNLEAIKNAEPPRLYIISDGPRANVPDDTEKVLAVRQYIENAIDWECELIKIYADNNMGCDDRSATGYDEVFKREEMAILIEDDAIAARSFFPFCEKMLRYYRDNEKVMMIAGQNRMPTYDTEHDYLFSVVPSKLAWATWRRAWNKYRETEKGDFDYDPKWLKENLTSAVRLFYEAKLIRRKMTLLDTWDAIWDCSMLANEAVGIVPKYNMISYIGANREDATHGCNDTELAHLPVKDFDDEVCIRTGEVIPDPDYDLKQQEHMIQGTYAFYLRSRMAYNVYKHFPKLYSCISGFFQ